MGLMWLKIANESEMCHVAQGSLVLLHGETMVLTVAAWRMSKKGKWGPQDVNNQQMVGERGMWLKERDPLVIGLGGKQIIFIRTKIITFIY